METSAEFKTYSIHPVQELLQTEREAQNIIKQAQEQAKAIRKQGQKEAESHLEEFKNLSFSKEAEFNK